MNLINKKVTHKRFGTGSIVGHNESKIEINFESENKMFVYPDVFGEHLKLHDKSDAKSLEEIIQKKEDELKEEEWKKEEEKKLQRKKQELRVEHEKLMKHHKLHPESQMVFWCDTEEQNSSLSEWKVFSGVIKSGKNKGNPNKPVRLHQNSAVLLTAVDSNMSEKDRRILGVYMVHENFVGKMCEDGIIPAHSKYRIQLTEEESDQLAFWEYYVNEKNPEKMTWNTGKYRYFDNLWMAQILLAIISLKSDPNERELAQQFFNHFCKMNQIMEQDIPKPNGAIMRT
ncbi:MULTISPECIES: malate synthase [unclassified Bacillus (in: firmicutes)]|uniref:malate synthase n=1 Tax=unclassified Bacillus (in: firmicutes) TaxID=185979 RepID=UPI00080AC50D|nr:MULTISPECIES: malate synthase [unclassified Bacillus (in: firmicutes)]OCA89454.1 malate synthase [Bacillus sp. FJAT-27986]